MDPNAYLCQKCGGNLLVVMTGQFPLSQWDSISNIDNALNTDVVCARCGAKNEDCGYWLTGEIEGWPSTWEPMAIHKKEDDTHA